MGPKCNHKCPFKGRFVIEGSVTTARYYSAGSEDGGGSQREARNAALEAGKGKETNAPLEPLEKARPCQYLDFGPVKLILDF